MRHLEGEIQIHNDANGGNAHFALSNCEIERDDSCALPALRSRCGHELGQRCLRVRDKVKNTLGNLTLSPVFGHSFSIPGRAAVDCQRSKRIFGELHTSSSNEKKKGKKSQTFLFPEEFMKSIEMNVIV